MNTTTNTTTTAIDSVYVGDVEVPLARIHAMAPDELTQFFYWVARVEYQRGREDGWEDLAEATKAYFDEGKALGRLEATADITHAYNRGQRDGYARAQAEHGQEDLAEAESKAYKDGRYQGQMEGHAEAFEQYQAQLKAELAEFKAEHDCVEALNL